MLICGLIYTITANNKEDITLTTVSSTLDSTVSSVTSESKVQQICIYICGCVNKPGVYMVNEGTRIHSVIELAGGLTLEAVPEYLNLADRVTDGQKIVVPSKTDLEAGVVPDVKEEETSTVLVNINTATESALMALPGIGEAKAKSIISYRDNHGKFKTIDEVKNVEGIKESLFIKIKDLIKV